MAKIMKKIFMLVAAVAMLASCSQDFVEDSNLPTVGDTTENVSWYDLGIKLVASIDDVTRVSVSGDAAAATSTMAWEQGDLVKVVYDGVVYEYACTNSGTTGEFAPTSNESYISALDATKPLVVYYNVKSVNATTLVATLDIPAEQVAGELSNKLPLYSYNAAPALVDNKLPIKMSALASVVEFDLKAASAWNVDSASFAATTRAAYLEAGFVAATDVLVDPKTGAIMPAETSVKSNAISLDLGSLKNVADGLKMQFIVGPAKFQGTSVEKTAENADMLGTFTGACLKLYKEGKENFRRTIWNTPETLVDLSQGNKHVYQAASNILDGHRDGIRTVEDLWAFRNEYQNAVESYPVGTGFCDEDGVVRLHADLSVENWKYIGHNEDANLVNLRWAGLFDGQDHTITYTMEYGTEEQKWTAIDQYGKVTEFSSVSAGFFNTICSGYIKNLTLKGNIHVTFLTPGLTAAEDGEWKYIGGVVGQMDGGTVENCKSYVNIDGTDHATGKFRVGGITGRMCPKVTDAEIIDCENYGHIDCRLKNAVNPLQTIVGGLVGLIGDDANNCLPYISNCTNHGNIYIGGNNFNGNHFVGGCIGVATSKQKLSFDIEEVTNLGEVKSELTPPNKQTLYIGGVVGRLQYATLYDCVNGEEGTEKGKVSDVSFTPPTWSYNEKNAVTAAYAVVTYMGGVVGNIDTAGTALESCVNYAPISTYAPANTSIGGVVGIQSITSDVTFCDNYGTITIDHSAVYNPFAVFGGGVLGKTGISGNADRDKYVTDCNNYGDVIANAPQEMGNYFGGVCGAVYGGTGAEVKTTPGAFVQDCVNEGNVVIVPGGGSSLYNRVGGIVGLCNSSSISGCTNDGNVYIYSAQGQNNSYGGVLGYDNQSEFTHAFTENINNGTVAVFCNHTPWRDRFEKDKWIAIGGVIGQINAKKGSVTVTANENYGVVAANIGDLVEENKEYFHKASVVGWWQNIVGCTSFADNVVGGEIGTTTPATEGYVYDPENPGTITSTKLDNTADSDYYWEKWLYSQVGSTAKKPATSGNSFGK